MNAVPIEYRNYAFFRYVGVSSIGSISYGGYHSEGKGVPQTRVLEQWYALIYVTRGRARFRAANGIDVELRPGDLFFLFPGLAHSYVPIRRAGPWSEVWFTFSGPIFDVWRDKGLLDPARPVSKLLPIDYWHRRLETLLEMGERLSGRNPVEQACALQLILAEALGADVAPDPADEARLWLAQASTCLDVETLTDAPGLDEVAAKMGVSYDQFRRKFRDLSGMTPYHSRIARIMDRASRMMQERRITNRELSEHLGFCSEFHFSRRFKQIVGMTPKEFRRRIGMSSDDVERHHKADRERLRRQTSKENSRPNARAL
jgi:AraC-like DNA-binding protein